MKKGFIEIKDEQQLEKFLDEMIDFHDGVVSKINYVSGSVGDREGTCPFDDKRTLTMTIEGVYCDAVLFDAVELLFEDLIKAFIAPNKPDYTTNISCAKIVLQNGRFVFVNSVSDTIDTININDEWNYHIEAKKLSYRIIDKTKNSKRSKVVRSAKV